jgi:hypothetical protein
MDLGTAELGLPGYPGVPFLLASWRQVAGNIEQACSRVAATGQLLWEVMNTFGRDVLHLARVSIKERILPKFLQVLLGFLTCPSLCFRIPFGPRCI